MSHPGDPYGQPQYGQQQYGQPQYGQPQYPQPQYGQPPYGYAPPRPRMSSPVVGWVLSALGVVVAVGSFTPWATINLFGFSRTIAGTEGDGVITVVCGLIVVAMGLVIGIGQGRLWTSVVALVLAVLIAAVGVIDLANLSSRFNTDNGLASSAVDVGYGLWLVVVGGVLALVMSIVALAVRRP